MKEDIKAWLNINLSEACKLSNDNYSMLLMLSTIDCFAQAWGGFPKSNTNQNFCDFVLAHTTKAEDLKALCPITLYYQYSDALPPLRLQTGSLIPYDSPKLRFMAGEYFRKLPKEEQKKAEEHHTYIKLLYVLRSKLVHELSNPGTPIEFVADKPTISCGRMFAGDKLADEYWTLNFPKKFVYELTWEVITNYLDECDEVPQREINLSWY